MHDSGSQPRQIEWALLFSAGQAWAGQGARQEHTRGIDSESRFWPPPRAPVLGTRPRVHVLRFRPSGLPQPTKLHKVHGLELRGQG